MTIRTPLAKAIRLAIGGAAGLTAALSAPLALAQDDDQIVYVTGSRIGRSADFDSPSPVVTVDREAIENSGYNNLQEILVQLPSAGNGTFSTRVNNQDSTANGTAGISLRGLGADATLVLVNGRRVAISSFAQDVSTGFVDINAIPVSAIERIEVLKDGASAVYGSDAVAGVVNIVLRKDFEGFEVSGSYGSTTSSGMDETNFSAIWGASSDDGNFTVMFDYFKNTTLTNAEIDETSTADLTARGGPDRRSSRSSPGLFLLDQGLASELELVDPACPPDRLAGICRYDYAPVNWLIPEAERTGLQLLGSRNLAANIEVFTEISVQHNRSRSQGAATPLDETAGITVPVTHPDTPTWISDEAPTTILVERLRTVDAGERQFDIETDNLRGVLGLRGTFADWGWEVTAQRARSESQQTANRNQGFIRTDFLQQQIDLGNYNPYGGTLNSQDVIDAITTSLVRQGESDLTAFDASVTGPLFDLPAGEVRMAAGVEYREESISDVPDDQFQRGLIFGTESVSAEADRDITSVFVEFSIPLLESLELQVAGRYDDYSDFGDTTNPKVALRWDVTDTFALRGSWAQGFRAPSLAQTGLGPSLVSSFLTDHYRCTDQGLDPDDPLQCPELDFLSAFSGNPDLSAEDSESFNIGAVWRPSAAFSLSVDFWDITQDDKIDRDNLNFLYETHCNDQSSVICIRGTPQVGDTLGPLNRILSSYLNIGEQSTQGIDLALTYSRDVRSATMSLGLDFTHLLEFEQVRLDSTGLAFETIDLVGEYEYPENRAAFRSDWVIGDWGIHTQLNYIDSFNDFRPLPATDSVRSVDSFVTTNLQLTYEGITNTKIALSVENVTDEEVPFAIGDGDDDVYGYVSSQHDPRGRFWSLKTTYSF